MGNYTPGPWEVRPTSSDWYEVSPEDSIFGLAAVHPVEYVDWDALANANLIAAAPELLEALEEIGDTTCPIKCREIAGKAIDKARGE